MTHCRPLRASGPLPSLCWPVAGLSLILLATAGRASGPAGLTPLGLLPSGSYSYVQGMNADATVFVGVADEESGYDRAVRWSGGTITSLGTVNGGSVSYAYGVSGDGSIVVGAGDDPTAGSVYRAFRWTQATGIVSLGTLNNGDGSYASGISADGTVIVGLSADGNAANAYRAIRWTQASGMVSLGVLPGGDYSQAIAASRDGSVIVGIGSNSAGDAAAFRWTQGGGLVGIGSLGNGVAYNISSMAFGVSADGSVVVGEAADGTANNETRAFRWTQGTGMVSLGTLSGGNYSTAKGVSGDGQVVVGEAQNAASEFRAFRWTSASGLQTVDDWLRANGVVLPQDVTSGAYATNADGSIVAGVLRDGRAFVARDNGLMVPAAYNPTLAATANAAPAAGAMLGNFVFNGAHHRTLLDNGVAGKRSGMWFTADAAHDHRLDADLALAEVGYWREMDDNRGRAGLGIGSFGSWQNLVYGGEARTTGLYGIAEVDYATTSNSDTSVAFTYGAGSARIRRSYPTLHVIDNSVGHSRVTLWAVRLRQDWRDLWQFGGFALSPFASLAHSESQLAGYQEHDGVFPASFAAQRCRQNEVRLGLSGRVALGTGVDLRLTAEAVQQFLGTVSEVQAEVLDFGAYVATPRRENLGWVRGGVELDWRCGEGSALLVGVHGATRGGDPTLTGSVSWKCSF